DRFAEAHQFPWDCVCPSGDPLIDGFTPGIIRSTVTRKNGKNQSILISIGYQSYLVDAAGLILISANCPTQRERRLAAVDCRPIPIISAARVSAGVPWRRKQGKPGKRGEKNRPP